MIDSVISAEIPDPNTDPILYDIIKRHMIHGPCGPLCNSAQYMKDGKCVKKFPKILTNHTMMGHNSFPMYRRRSTENGGYTVIMRSNLTTDGSFHITNTCVVYSMPISMWNIAAL
eukprot:GHVR01059587.1.p1 GENE.GHVR01059587.1~~GHVR01059587.1.p1  ORF type:complete len:115 (+),score=1.13 GHVR01059587.1:221-565(+)